jgi:release factor glutamine methyltransferase
MGEPTEAPWTVLRLLNWTKEYFARAGLNSPRLAAEILLTHVLGCGRIDLYARFDRQPTAAQLKAYRELVARARKHEPVAYLVGRKEFYSLSLRVTPDVLVPRPETEILVDEAVAYLRALPRPGRMWDACTGSGCVAVATAARVPTVTVLATDISAAAAAVAAANAEDHGLTDRVRCRAGDLLCLPDDCGEWRQADLITANPPYVCDGDEVAEEVACEPEIAIYAGPDGLDVIRRLIADAPRFLVPGGALAMEFGLGQADMVRDLIAETDCFEEPRILLDHQELERTAVAIRR